MSDTGISNLLENTHLTFLSLPLHSFVIMHSDLLFVNPVLCLQVLTDTDKLFKAPTLD